MRLSKHAADLILGRLSGYAALRWPVEHCRAGYSPHIAPRKPGGMGHPDRDLLSVHGDLRSAIGVRGRHRGPPSARGGCHLGRGPSDRGDHPAGDGPRVVRGRSTIGSARRARRAAPRRGGRRPRRCSGGSRLRSHGRRGRGGVGWTGRLVYTAGMSPLGRLVDMGGGGVACGVETNVVGAALVCRRAIPHLQASSGRAVFLSSIWWRTLGRSSCPTERARPRSIRSFAGCATNTRTCASPTSSSVRPRPTLGTGWDPTTLGELAEAARNAGW